MKASSPTSPEPWVSRHHLPLGEIRQRAQAVLVGGAVGDALGATLEFMTPGEIRAQFGKLREIRGGGWLNLPKGAVTDDTEMSLCVARSIVNGGFSPRDIADHFVGWMRSRPRDIGGTCRRGIRRYIANGSLECPASDADGGNGAVMRMAPVAIASLADSEIMERWAVGQAHLTHNNPLSDAACILVGHMIHLGCIGYSKFQLRRFVNRTLEQWPQFGFDGRESYCSPFVVDTMRTVLHHFFTTRNFELCLVATVNQGGDSDTAGAIAGAIAGAYYGWDSIPRRWITALDPVLTRELDDLAFSLVAGSPIANGW